MGAVAIRLNRSVWTNGRQCDDLLIYIFLSDAEKTILHSTDQINQHFNAFAISQAIEDRPEGIR